MTPPTTIEAVAYLSAIVAVAIVWLTRGQQWRRLWHWWLAALALKMAATAATLAHGTAEMIDAILLITDPAVLALHCMAVAEVWMLLTTRLNPGEWRALFGLCCGLAGLAVAAVLGYWAGDTGFSIYSDVRMSAHAVMLAFLLAGGLWVALHDIRRPRGVAGHAAGMLATVAVYVRYDLYRAATMEDWRQAQVWCSSLLLACLCWWLVDAILQPRHSGVHGVKAYPKRLQ